MESKFTHYLITRFNVKIDGYGPEYFPPGVRNVSWEQERLPLFEHFCASTVAGQSTANFRWLIYCDTSTDIAILDEIRRIVAQVPGVGVFLVADFKKMISHLRDVCASSSTTYVITSRLDNDDGLGRDYIRMVQDHFEPSDKVVLNLSGGVIYNMDRKILTHLHQSLNNSFISLVEEVQPASNFLTVYGFRHLAPPPKVRIKNIKYSYAFWMNLHDQNAGRRYNRGRPLWSGDYLQHYAIDPAYIHISWMHILSYAMRWFPVAVIKKAKNIFRFKKSTN